MTLFNRGHRQHPDWRELVSLQGTGITISARCAARAALGSAIDTCCYRPEQAASLHRPGGALRAPHLHLHHQRLSRLRPARDGRVGAAARSGPDGSATGYGLLRYCVRPSIGPAGERLCILRPRRAVRPLRSHRSPGLVGEAGAARWALAAAGEGQDRLQYLDVRDGAEFVLRAAEQRLEGCYNLIKPGIPWRTGWSASPPAGAGDGTNPSGGPGPPPDKGGGRAPGRPIPPCCRTSSQSMRAMAASAPRPPSSTG